MRISGARCGVLREHGASRASAAAVASPRMSHVEGAALPGVEDLILMRHGVIRRPSAHADEAASLTAHHRRHDVRGW